MNDQELPTQNFGSCLRSKMNYIIICVHCICESSFSCGFFLGIPKYEGPSDSLQTWSLRETNCSILPRSKSQFQNISMATGENIYKTTWLPTKKVAQDIWFLYIYIYSYIHDTLPEINVDDSCADVFYIWYMIYIYKSYTNILQFRLVLNKSKLLNDIPSPIDSWWQERRVGSRCIWGRSLIDNLQNET